MSYIYLASPYSRYSCGQAAAYEEALKATADLIRFGYNVFSPIVYTHNLAWAGVGLDPLDAAAWMALDEPYMDAADGCIVLMLEGWQDSIGVAHEINRFAAMGKPIVLMVPGEVPDLSEVFG